MEGQKKENKFGAGGFFFLYSIPIPKNMLPVRLPEKINLNVKGNPLNSQNDY